MPRPQSLFGSSARSKHCKTLVHSRSSSSSRSTANKENSPSSSGFVSLSSNQTTPPVTPKFCRLPLSSLQTNCSPQPLTTSSQSLTPSSTYKTRNHVGPSFKRLRQYEEQQQQQSKKPEATSTAKDSLNFYQIIHNDFLLQLMRNTDCCSCSNAWNGTMAVRKREGLYCSLEFLCTCGNTIKINTSKQCEKSKFRDINVRSVIGSHLSGVGHAGMLKLCGAMNFPPPIDEDHFSNLLNQILPSAIEQQQKSMQNAVEGACTEASSRDLVVSGDGSWQKRGFSSHNGVAAVMSSSDVPKVLDIERLSKRCTVCDGAKSIKQSDPLKFEQIMSTHQCQLNYKGSSGAMEMDGIHRIFCRSIDRYNVRYLKYIGDGDAKTMIKLRNEPPYSDLTVEKIEDVNHWCKKMQHRLEKVRNEVKNQLIDGKKGISGSNRLTQNMIINFKYYYRQAIVRNKTNLDEMVKAVWAVYKHKSSTNSDPYHEWCSPVYCGFWKALEKGEEYDHTPHSLPKGVMKAIRPVFEELASHENLSRVLNGSTQNPNESYHSVLWSMAPKSRCSSGTIIDFCVALSTIVYNDGFQSLLPLFDSLLGSSGTFTSSIFQRLDQQRASNEARTMSKSARHSMNSLLSNINKTQDEVDDSYVPGAY